MEKLHLMNGPYLTNAAMLLFSKDPEKWQLGAYVKIGYFETDATCCIRMKSTVPFWNRSTRSWSWCISST